MLLKRIYLASLFFCPLVGFSAEGDAGHGSVEFGIGYYHNDDAGNGSDGNPFLDEELTVIEPIIIFDYSLSDQTAIFGSLSYDYVSSASIDRLDNFPEQSGASGDYYIGVDLGLRRELTDTESAAVNTHVSVEYDYVSVGLGGEYSVANANGSASRTYALNGFYDTIDIIRFDGTEGESDTRLTLTGTYSAYQIINPLTHADYGLSLTLQNGFLETAYNAVVIEDTGVSNPNLVGGTPGREVTEELDDNRIRFAAFGRVRHSISVDHAVELGGRLYADSWGITSLAIEPRWITWITPDSLRLRLRYRLYVQTEADDYQEHFTTEPSLRTQDSDLAAFTAQTAGALLTWILDENHEADFGVDYILRSDDLNQILARVAYRKKF